VTLPIFPAGDGTYFPEENQSDSSSGDGLTGAAGGDLTGNYPSPLVSVGAITLAKIAASASNPAAGTAGLRSLGSTGITAAPGDHSHPGVYSPVAHTHVESDVTALVSDLGALDSRLDVIEASPGSSLRITRTRVTTGTPSGNTNPDTSGAFLQLNGVGEIAIQAAVGDFLELHANFLATDLNGVYFDFAIKKSAALVWFGSSETSTPSTEGDPSMYPTLGPKGTGYVSHVVEAGTLSVDNMVHFVLAIRAAGSGLTFYSTSYPFRWILKNFGAPSV
jgi:hypothetical protein